MGVSEICCFPLVLTSPLSTIKERQIRRDASEKNKGLLKENSDNKKYSGKRFNTRTQMRRRSRDYPGQNGGESLPGHAAVRGRTKETARQASLRCSETLSLPSAERITNGEQGQGKKKRSGKAVGAAVSPRSSWGSPWPGAATHGAALPCGSGCTDFGMLWSPERTGGRAPCFRPLFLMAP